MHTQNVKTAAPESSERWGEGHKINGLTTELSEGLDYLITLRKQRMMAIERAELLHGRLCNIASAICFTVTDWSLPHPVLPYSSVLAWMKAREITLTEFGEDGKAAWDYACSQLRTDLMAGYAMWRDDIA